MSDPNPATQLPSDEEEGESAEEFDPETVPKDWTKWHSHAHASVGELDPLLRNATAENPPAVPITSQLADLKTVVMDLAHTVCGRRKVRFVPPAGHDLYAYVERIFRKLKELQKAKEIAQKANEFSHLAVVHGYEVEKKVGALGRRVEELIASVADLEATSVAMRDGLEATRDGLEATNRLVGENKKAIDLLTEMTASKEDVNSLRKLIESRQEGIVSLILKFLFLPLLLAVALWFLK